MYLNILNNRSVNERKNEIICEILMYSFNSIKVKIMDPYFEFPYFENFLNNCQNDSLYNYDFSNNSCIWEHILHDFLVNPNIEEIQILTKKNEMIRTCQNISGNSSEVAVNRENNPREITINDKKLKIYYYRENRNNYFPKLHDRFIIFINQDDEINSLHVGCSMKDYENKDFLYSKLNKNISKKIDRRFDELKEIL